MNLPVSPISAKGLKDRTKEGRRVSVKSGAAIKTSTGRVGRPAWWNWNTFQESERKSKTAQL